MPITRVKNWQAGEQLLATDLNNEFNNIVNNAVIEPAVLTQSFDLNGQTLIFDQDGDTVMESLVNDTLNVTLGGATDFTFTPNLLTAVSGSAITMTAGNVNMTSGDVVFTSGRTLAAKAADVASATTITVPTSGNVFDLTGTTTIESFSTSQAGTTYRVRYTGAGLNLIYNATSLILPYSTDYRLTTGEIFDLVSLGSGNYYIVIISGANHLQPGTPFQWWGTTAPTGGVLMDAAALNCTTYYGLSKILVPSAATLGNSGTSVATFTVDASTDVLTCAGHGLSVNDIVHVTTSAADLPLNLLINTVYFVKTVPDANTLTLSATRGGATFDIGDAGTGTHTLHNKVNAPDARGRAWVGLDNLGGSAASRITSASTNGTNSTTLGGAGGAQTHTLVDAEVPSQQITVVAASLPSGGGIDTGFAYGTTLAAAGPNQTYTSEGGGAAHSNTPPWIAGGMVIRF